MHSTLRKTISYILLFQIAASLSVWLNQTHMEKMPHGFNVFSSFECASLWADEHHSEHAQHDTCHHHMCIVHSPYNAIKQEPFTILFSTKYSAFIEIYSHTNTPEYFTSIYRPPKQNA